MHIRAGDVSSKLLHPYLFRLYHSLTTMSAYDSEPTMQSEIELLESILQERRAVQAAAMRRAREKAPV
jgi:hypothetical protein